MQQQSYSLRDKSSGNKEHSTLSDSVQYSVIYLHAIPICQTRILLSKLNTLNWIERTT